MRFRVLTLFAGWFIAAAALAQPAADRSKQEFAKLQGKWLIGWVEFEGKARFPGGVESGTTIIFRDDRTLSFQDPLGVLRGDTTATIDASREPKRIDMGWRGGRSLGLYQFVDADTVKLYIDESGKEERPKQLKTAPGSQGRIYVLIRDYDLPATAAAKKERERLQGTWKITKYEIEGRGPSLDELRQTSAVIEGDRLTLKGGALLHAAVRLTIDPERQPAALDQRPERRNNLILRSIYELKDDTLRICFPLDMKEAARPKEFVSKTGSGTGLVILKRDKK